MKKEKISRDDKGEITITIYEKKKIVIIEFGEKIKWIGFTKDEAQDLGKILIKEAKNI